MNLIDFNCYNWFILIWIEIMSSFGWLCGALFFFYFHKMTFLDFVDMYLMIFDINCQYLAKFSQYLASGEFERQDYSRKQNRHGRLFKWAWVINSLVPGWGTGPEKNWSQSIWFCLILEPGFLLFFGTGLIFEVPISAARKMFALPNGRPTCCDDHNI